MAREKRVRKPVTIYDPRTAQAKLPNHGVVKENGKSKQEEPVAKRAKKAAKQRSVPAFVVLPPGPGVGVARASPSSEGEAPRDSSGSHERGDESVHSSRSDDVILDLFGTPMRGDPLSGSHAEHAVMVSPSAAETRQQELTSPPRVVGHSPGARSADSSSVQMQESTQVVPLLEEEAALAAAAAVAEAPSADEQRRAAEANAALAGVLDEAACGDGDGAWSQMPVTPSNDVPPTLVTSATSAKKKLMFSGDERKRLEELRKQREEEEAEAAEAARAREEEHKRREQKAAAAAAATAAALKTAAAKQQKEALSVEERLAALEAENAALRERLAAVESTLPQIEERLQKKQESIKLQFSNTIDQRMKTYRLESDRKANLRAKVAALATPGSAGALQRVASSSNSTTSPSGLHTPRTQYSPRSAASLDPASLKRVGSVPRNVSPGHRQTQRASSLHMPPPAAPVFAAPAQPYRGAVQ